MSEIILSPITAEDMDVILRLASSKKGYLQALLDFYNSEAKNPFKELLIDNEEPAPLHNILTIIRKRFNGFGISEYPYLDVEYWDSYSGFYGTCFSPQPRECVRYHFFHARKGVSLVGLPNKITQLLKKGASEKQILKYVEYCGYTVIRPISSNVVGRTAIKFDDRSTRELAAQGLEGLEPVPGRPLLKTSQDCSVTVLNAHFTLRTPEFIQQDPQLGQCATASLWVAGNIAARKFGTRQLRFPSITKNAFGEKLPAMPTGYAYVDPSSGLYASEIKNALSVAGSSFQSEKYETEDSLLQAIRISHFVYSYVESGLPVILCLDSLVNDTGHAVAAVGHFLPEGIKSENLHKLGEITHIPGHQHHRIICSAITSYYVHDDCNGPFNKLNISVELEKPTVRECPSGKGKACIDNDIEEMYVARCNFKSYNPANVGSVQQEEGQYILSEAITPVHFRIRLTSWTSLMSAVNEHAKCESKEDKGKYIYLWRSFLISGGEFKRSLPVRKYSASTKKFYASLHMPKYMWVHEYTKTTAKEIVSCFPASNESPRSVHGEFIFDATTPSRNMQLISLRMEGAMWSPADSKIIADERWKPVPCFQHSDIL